MLLFTVLLALWSLWLLRRGSRRSRRRTQRAQRGEQAAERLLTRAGYRIEDRQVSVRSSFVVNGEDVAFLVRIDLLVRRKGRAYVAEVKTGSSAPDPAHPPTRRQLREYAALFPDHGILLVDVEAQQIHRIDFPVLHGPNP